MKNISLILFAAVCFSSFGTFISAQVILIDGDSDFWVTTFATEPFSAMPAVSNDGKATRFVHVGGTPEYGNWKGNAAFGYVSSLELIEFDLFIVSAEDPLDSWVDIYFWLEPYDGTNYAGYHFYFDGTAGEWTHVTIDRTELTSYGSVGLGDWSQGGIFQFSTSSAGSWDVWLDNFGFFERPAAPEKNIIEWSLF